MTIPQSDLLLVIIGSIASVTSFLITVLYPIRKKRLPTLNKVRSRSELVEVCITIDGKTINAEVSPKDMKKISNILKKHQKDDIELPEGSYRH